MSDKNALPFFSGILKCKDILDGPLSSSIITDFVFSGDPIVNEKASEEHDVISENLQNRIVKYWHLMGNMHVFVYIIRRSFKIKDWFPLCLEVGWICDKDILAGIINFGGESKYIVFDIFITFKNKK